MDTKLFSETFAANLDATDVAEETLQDLHLRARNTIDVLRCHRVSVANAREMVAGVLSHWTRDQLEPLLEDSSVDWFATPQREELLRSLFEEMIRYIYRP